MTTDDTRRATETRLTDDEDSTVVEARRALYHGYAFDISRLLDIIERLDALPAEPAASADAAWEAIPRRWLLWNDYDSMHTEVMRVSDVAAIRTEAGALDVDAARDGRCPECGQAFSTKGLPIHRGIKHGTERETPANAYLEGLMAGRAEAGALDVVRLAKAIGNTGIATPHEAIYRARAVAAEYARLVGGGDE